MKIFIEKKKKKQKNEKENEIKNKINHTFPQSIIRMRFYSKKLRMQS